MPQKTIEAVVEVSSFESESPWAVLPVPSQALIRLFSGVTDEEIGSIILTACLYNQIEICPSAMETLNSFLEKEQFVLPGGLQFSEDGQAKVVPGCCCGLEDWHGWLSVPHGNNGVWAGHDPSPGVEFVDGNIRVWQDEKAEGVEFIDLDDEEMRGLLDKVESDLKGFVIRLGKWADYLAPDLNQKIAEHFAKNMNIEK
jgi:hypothetical protein